MEPTLPYPPAIDLARLDTPLQRLPRLSHRLGAELWVKRDDLTGAALSGNKVRKLEFLLAEAIDRGCGGVVTCGGEQSNHARATAIAAARCGLRCHLLLRTADPDRPPATEGNILLGRLAGATIRWISPADYARREPMLAQEARRLGDQLGQPFYVIPEGGSNPLGAWGYVRCAAELAGQLGNRSATVISAVGSGARWPV